MAAWGDENQHTRKVAAYLPDFYDAWGKPQMAAEWRAKLAESEEPTEQGELASQSHPHAARLR